MQNSEKQAIVTKILGLIGEKKKYPSQNKAAAALGVSAAALSQILNGVLDKTSDDKWLELAQKLGMRDQIAKDWQIVETQNYKRFTKACEDARQNALFNAIIADTGMGKSTALKKYASDRRGVYYVWCPIMYTVKHLIQAIAEAMDISPEKLTSRDLYQRIVDKLRTVPNALLILDSAHRLEKNYAMQFVGDLAEAIEGRAGLVIAGMPELKDKIEFGKTKGKTGYAELERRIFHWTTGIAPKGAEFQKDLVSVSLANGLSYEEFSEVIDAKDSRAMESFGLLNKSIRKLKLGRA